MIDLEFEIGFYEVVYLRYFIIDLYYSVSRSLPRSRVHACDKQPKAVDRSPNNYINYLHAVLVWLHSFLVNKHLLQWFKEVYSERLPRVADSDYISVLIIIQVSEGHQVSS